MNILVAYFLGTIFGGLSAVVVCLLVKFYQKKIRSPIKSLPSEAFNPHEAEADGSEGSNPYVTPFGLDVILDVEEESQEDMVQESELSPKLTLMPPLPSYPFYGGEISFEFNPHLSPELPPMTFGEMIGWPGFQ